MKQLFKFFMIIFLLFPSIVEAEVKEIIAEGSYNMGKGETPTVAESRALLQAKRVAIEQAGTYIESYSKINKFQLTHDEIRVLSSGIIEVVILQTKRTITSDGIAFAVKIKAKVSTDKIEVMSSRVKEKEILEQYKRLQEDYGKSQKEIEGLKKQLKEGKTAQAKQRVERLITINEKAFQAREWYEKGNSFVINKDSKRAIDAFSRAINFDGTYLEAYVARGVSFSKDGINDEALEDFSMAIKLNANYALAYQNRASVYCRMDRYERAIEDYSKAISLDPDYDSAYIGRGAVYALMGQHEKGLKDINWAIKIYPYNSLAYQNRGIIYSEMRQYDSAFEDYTKAIELDRYNGSAYLL